MSDAAAWLDRLVRATNAHDLDGVVGCFADDYQNITPAHPARGFVGNAQVRSNWRQIFAAFPDFRADVVAAAFDGSAVWAQLEMTGTRGDGTTHRTAGVVVFEIAGETARKATFFLEPVDESPGSVDDAIRQQVAR